MRKSGLAFHCHHNQLIEYVWDFNERVKYIKKDKPKEEQELRLRLFKIIPDDRLPGDVRKAWAAYDEAKAAYEKAWAAREKAINDNKDYFIKLHAELCPDCPWDGKTIFPGKEG